MGGQSKWPQLMWLEYLADRIGGPDVIQAIEDNKPNSWSNPAVIKANTMIQQLVDAGGFTKGFSSISTDSSADLALLYTGRAGMILQGSWGYPGIKTADPTFISSGKLGYTTFPTVTGGTGAPTDIVGNPANFWSMSSDANAGAQTAAQTYLKSGVLNEANIDALIAGGSVPPVTGLDAKIAKATDPDYLELGLQAGGEGTGLPAVLGSGHQPRRGGRAADQPGPDLPQADQPPGVRHRHEQDDRDVT